MPSYWTCRKCGHVNLRTASRRCLGCGSNTKRARERPAHRRALSDNVYADYAVLSVLIHGGEPHACARCGRPKPDSSSRAKYHHRDHDHVTGKPRGLLCFQCNATGIGNMTLDDARLNLRYLEAVDAFYSGGAEGVSS